MREKKISKIYSIPYLFPALFMVLLLAGSLAFWQTDRPLQPVLTLSDWTLGLGGKEEPITLPGSLKDLPPRTALTLTAEILPEAGDYLYVKSVYTPVRVCINDTLIYEYGEDGSFPAIFADPPTNVELLPIPRTGSPAVLRLELQSPASRNTVALHPVLMGTPNAILQQLFSHMGFSLSFSIILLALGVILLLIAFVIIRLNRAGFSFFWLGLFSILVGTWVLGECNLTSIFIHNPPLLYLMAFMGLFSFTIPFMKFVMLVLDFEKKGPLQTLCRILVACNLAALLLQLTGAVPLAKSMYLFHVLQPLTLCALGIRIFVKAVRGRDALARRFAMPILILALFSVLEVLNYYALRMTDQMSLFFQIGVLIFIIMASLICGDFVKNAFETQTEKRRLQYENTLMGHQIEVQKERYAAITEMDAQIRAQRHDLRHQLTVLHRFAENGDMQKLTDYLAAQLRCVPVPLVRYCENEAVNAVATYYVSFAGKMGITDCKLSLNIPNQTGDVTESELCVIIGNLLENALEACRGAAEGKPYIHMKSRLQDGILTIVMDNYFQSVTPLPDGGFRSLKQGGGTGLLSIRAVAQKYGGGARFETKGEQFCSSVYLRLDELCRKPGAE